MSRKKMTAKVQRIGDSVGAVIGPDDARKQDLAEGDQVVLRVRKRTRKKRTDGIRAVPRSASDPKDGFRGPLYKPWV